MEEAREDRQSVCLIGAGIMGITTAYYLMRSGRCADIVLLEEGEPAGGASGKAAGFLAKDWHSAPTSSLGTLSYQLHTILSKELNGGERFGYRKVPSMSMHVEKGRGEGIGSMEDPIQSWLSPDNVRDMDIVGTDDTAQVHPELFCQAVLEECIRGGVRLVGGRAERVTSSKERHVIHHSKGQLTAKSVVICAGPWSGRVAKELLDIDVAVKELAGHSVVLKPSKSLPPLAIFASVADRAGHSTATPELFSRPDGTVYIAGENSGAPLPPGTAAVKTSDESMERLLSACKLISPLLDTTDAEVVKKALCYRPVSKRGYPYLCKLPHRPGLFLTAGHGPWGISLGPGTGKVMSELILDGKASSADISLLGL